MPMLSTKDFNSADLDTMRVSRRLPTVITASGSIETNEEATVYVRDLDLFVTRRSLEDTPPVLSLGTLCEDRGNSNEWIKGQKAESYQTRQKNTLQH